MWALVTGASSGIGYELARELLNRGYSILVSSSGERLDTAAANLRRVRGTVKEAQANLATSEGVEQLWKEVDPLGEPLDVACINAGCRSGRIVPGDRP